MLVLRDAKLIHGQPVIARRVIEVNHPRLPAADLPAAIAVLDRHTVDDQPMQRPVAGYRIDAFGPRQLAEGVVQSVRRKLRIQTSERIAQTTGQHHLRVVATLGG